MNSHPTAENAAQPEAKESEIITYNHSDDYFIKNSKAYNKICEQIFTLMMTGREPDDIASRDFIEDIYLDWSNYTISAIDLEITEEMSTSISLAEVKKLKYKIFEVLKQINLYRMVEAEYYIFQNELLYENKICPRLYSGNIHVQMWLKTIMYISIDLKKSELNLIAYYADKVIKTLAQSIEQYTNAKPFLTEHLNFKRAFYHLEQTTTNGDELYNPEYVLEEDYDVFFKKSLVSFPASMTTSDRDNFNLLISTLVLEACNKASSNHSETIITLKNEILKNLGTLEKIYVECMIAAIMLRVSEFSRWSSQQPVTNQVFLELQLNYFNLLNILITIQQNTIYYAFLDDEYKILKKDFSATKACLYQYARKEKSQSSLDNLNNFYHTALQPSKNKIEDKYLDDFISDVRFWRRRSNSILTEDSVAIVTFNNAIIMSVIQKLEPVSALLTKAVKAKTEYLSELSIFVRAAKHLLKIRETTLPKQLKGSIESKEPKPADSSSTNKSQFFHLKQQPPASIPAPAIQSTTERKRRASL